MLETLAKYLSVYLTSTVKFVFGPIWGMLNDLSVLESAIFSILGMMTTVLVIMFFGEPIRNWVNKRFRTNRRLFTRRSRQMVRVWNRYGLIGVAFLTPVLLSPIGGAMIALSFGGSRKRVLQYMFVSAVFWAFTQSFLFVKFGQFFKLHELIG